MFWVVVSHSVRIYTYAWCVHTEITTNAQAWLYLTFTSWPHISTNVLGHVMLVVVTHTFVSKCRFFLLSFWQNIRHPQMFIWWASFQWVILCLVPAFCVCVCVCVCNRERVCVGTNNRILTAVSAHLWAGDHVSGAMLRWAEGFGVWRRDPLVWWSAGCRLSDLLIPPLALPAERLSCLGLHFCPGLAFYQRGPSQLLTHKHTHTHTYTQITTTHPKTHTHTHR